MPHPLEIVGPAPGKKQKYLQPRFPQIGPAGDGPRVIMAAQSGGGTTSATLVFLKNTSESWIACTWFPEP